MAVEVRSPMQDGVACDSCGGRSFERLHAWEVGNRWNPASIPIAVWACPQCQLVMLHPVPKPEEMHDGREWWSAQRNEFRRNRWFKDRWEKVRHTLFGDSALRLINATRRAVPSGRLLDVGAGMGELLGFARSHYQCAGLEPSPIAANSLREKGFQVIESAFEDAELPPASFDVITMDSVIEHVFSPTCVLAKINRLLRPGGVIVLKTPKFGGPAYRMHAAEWNGFRHGHHTFLFSGATLGAFLEKTGFKVMDRPKRDRMFDDILILWGQKVREVGEKFLRKAA